MKKYVLNESVLATWLLIESDVVNLCKTSRNIDFFEK